MVFTISGVDDAVLKNVLDKVGNLAGKGVIVRLIGGLNRHHIGIETGITILWIPDWGKPLIATILELKRIAYFLPHRIAIIP